MIDCDETPCSSGVLRGNAPGSVLFTVHEKSRKSKELGLTNVFAVSLV
jgi:hypothetical protein